MPNLYLLGFMATGKSVLGRRIARALGLRFIDSDACIEEREGMKISEIFALHGEEHFRSLERNFIESGHPETGCVVSCGGGICCREGMPELIKSKGVSVVLFSEPKEILKRAVANKNRPLLDVPDPEAKIRKLLDERLPFYMRSGVAIATDSSLELTQERILKIYEKRCKSFLKDKKHGQKK